MIYINEARDIALEEWKSIIETFGLSKKLQTAETIIIKPNFAAGTYVDPQTHVMTDQALLRSSVEFIHSENPGATIYIAEADSTGYGFAYLKFEHLGLPESLNLSESALKKVKLLDMSRDRLKRVEDNRFRRYVTVDSQLWLSQTLLDAGFIVDLSNLKTHTVTGFTGACKNLFGCLPDFEKYHNHPYIHQTIHDLVIAIHPDLCVVDAFYGMEQNGPVQGNDVDTGYRIFSDDPVEADVYSAITIGYPPRRVKYLRLLCKSLGHRFETNIKVVKKYKHAETFVRTMNFVGLFIQRVGLGLETFGHRIHTCHSILNLCITIARPILLRMFDYEKLKAMKRKVIK